MKINKINYVSAVYFFFLFLVLYFITGIVQLIVEKMNPGTFGGFGLATPSFVTSVIYAPVVGGLLGGLFVLFAILLYNVVAKKFPFSFEVSVKK
ncbi:hypothetical protein J4226_06105 [Candidatus Pacearchaeota archaeon]|nr:hypothetical protein [Candidatus Pacearchaeota archaeon]